MSIITKSLSFIVILFSAAAISAQESRPTSSHPLANSELREICETALYAVDASIAIDQAAMVRYEEGKLPPKANICHETGICYESLSKYLESSIDLAYLRSLRRRSSLKLMSLCERHVAKTFSPGPIEGQMIHGVPIKETEPELLSKGLKPGNSSIMVFRGLSRKGSVTVEKNSFVNESGIVVHQCLDLSKALTVAIEEEEIEVDIEGLKVPICFDSTKTVTQKEFDEKLEPILNKRFLEKIEAKSTRVK